MLEDSCSRLLTDHNIARASQRWGAFFMPGRLPEKIDLASPAAASTQLGIQKRLFDKRIKTLNER